MIDASFFVANRNRLITQLKGGSVVLSAHTKMQRSNDAASPFEQESNFWWLTGIDAPDWWLVIDGSKHKTWLVMPSVSDVHQVFDGSLSAEDAKRTSGVGKVVLQDEGIKLLRDLAKHHSVIHTLGDVPYAEHLDFILNPAPKKMYDQLKRTFNAVQDCRKDIAVLRAIKQDEEIAALQRAINLTADAFTKVKKNLTSFKYEYEVEAEFTYHFRRVGANHAYDPIVAGGGNACTLHYGDNSARLKKRELLLMDIGARVDGYPADITRTYAYGEPTKRQTQIFEAVQKAQYEIINLIAPDLSIGRYQSDVDRIMTEALLSVGLMKHAGDEKSFRRYFPHAISHGLGVDVHDSLGGPKRLLPGMVLTVEPGIYIPEENIGVRIEDDILVTPGGHKNLSGSLSTGLQ